MTSHRIAAPLLFLFLLFSFWLMVHTFSYEGEKHAMLVSQKVWSDFGQHIPLIRSFSLGNNFPFGAQGKPVQFPLFPGEPIHYHFLFYLLVGLLERAGIRIDWALNIPSIAGFFLLLTGIFALAKKLFRDARVAILSVLFFLFNGSLSFLYFFQKHPLSLHTITDILTVNNFSAFAPWDKTDITAFWNLNIYTNQRHLALAFGIAIIFLFVLLHMEKKPWKKQLPIAVFFGILFGIFPFFHQPTLLIIAGCQLVYFFLFPKLRISLFLSAALTLSLIIPQLLFITKGTKELAWYPGYLIHESPTPIHFLRFWFLNLGLHTIFIPLGWLLSSQKIRRFFIPVFVIFIFANLFKFSVEVAASHKFFNFALILGNMLSAFALVWGFDRIRRRHDVLKFTGLTGLTLLLIVLVLSGIIDFFVIFNDPLGVIADIPTNKTAAWIAANTPRDAVFLNSSFLYHPASVAGRSIFLGWPYFAWSEGYDTLSRLKIMQDMYKATDSGTLCPLLNNNHVRYVSFQDHNPAEELLFRESTFQQSFRIVLSQKEEGWRIYDVATGCEPSKSP